ncbi:MAG: MBL fold metallo-hydrolase [Synergistaceae bacterium]|nr:MBL fold metallo-hydrolase [Synergistaceae bacterium]
MLKFITALLLAAVMVQGASASVISLVDVQGESDTALLVGANEDLTAKYYPDGKMPSQILAFWVNGVLYDAGLKDGHIVSELAKNGVKASDVTTILITHLHPDHFGGLVDAEGRAAFPKADVFVSKPEYDYWVSELKNGNVINTLKLYPVHTFMFGDEVIPGVRAMDTSGHTPGHVSYLVDDSLIIAGDIMHFPEIQLPAPDVSVRYDVDPAKAAQSRKFLLDYAAWKKVPVAGMHITPPGVINVRKSGEGYETF